MTIAADTLPDDRDLADVAIVGYGPTGAMFANLLGQRGWNVVVLEREPGLLDLPRAVHFDGEVMRIFDAAGLADAVAPLVRPSSGMQYVNTAGKLMLERKAAQSNGLHGWANNYLFHQPDLENVLRRGVDRFSNVRVLLRHEVQAVAQSAQATELTVRNLDTGATRQLRARWVVGCDGARSLVRDAVGAGHIDLGLHQSWLVIDVLLTSDHVDLPRATVQFCDPARPITFVNVTGLRRRWEIMLMPGDDPATMTDPVVVWGLIARWVTPADATLVRGAIYTFHSLVADRWRNGRLLIAGDSAHQTPPFLGQGMCAGIRDAANLAWKQDLVLHGADDSLLDSYYSERAPHVQEFVTTAVRLGNIIQTTDPAVAAQRDHTFEAGGPQEIVNLSPPLGPGVHTGGRPAGTLPGQPRLSDGRLLDKSLGGGFAVLKAGGPIGDDLAAADRRKFEQMGTRWTSDPALASWLAGLGAPMVVLRPDRYVFGVAADTSQLARLARALPSLPDSRTIFKEQTA